MRVSIIQTALQWESPEANRSMLSAKLTPLQGQTDLVVLPEMFPTGFSMNAGTLAETMDGPTMHWLSETAGQLGAALTGSFICVENGRHYNRLVWMFPDGQFQYYDKRHLFALAGEHKHFAAGRKRILVEWKGWRICPLICYDLRFPVWSRNAAGQEEDVYDMLIYVANWPVRRSHHWRSLLLARAIENQAFTIGVNIFGTDGSGLEYSGDSAVVDFSGQPLCQISGQEGIGTTELSLEDMREYRRQLPFLHDGDAFRLT